MSEELNQIMSRYNLPESYLDFLKETPDNLNYEGEDFVNWLRVYGYKNLIKSQEGYSFNPMKNEVISDWPKDYLVIADDGADPYVLDLSNSDENEAPVLCAMHGTGKWDFQKQFETVREFIRYFQSQKKI